MGKKYSDDRIDAIAYTAELKGYWQAQMGRTAEQVAEDMKSIEILYGPLSEQDELIARSHMDEHYKMVDNIGKHPVKRR